MGTELNWISDYDGTPGSVDDRVTNFPTVTDGVHDVMASHVNELADAVIQLETIQAAAVTSTLQTVYENGNTLSVTSGQGTVSLSNTTDATDVLSITRTFTGLGNAIAISMGATTTDDAIEIIENTTGNSVLMNVQGGDSESRLSTVGLKFLGTGAEFGLVGVANTGLGIDGRPLRVEAAPGSAGDTGTIPGDGGDLSVWAGSSPTATVAGGGAGGELLLRGGKGSVAFEGGQIGDPGNTFIGQPWDTSGAYVPPAGTANLVLWNGGITEPILGSGAGSIFAQAFEGSVEIYAGKPGVNAVIVDAFAAGGGIQFHIESVETARIEADKVLFPTGSATEPSITFLADDDTGFRRFGANTIGVINGATEYWIFSSESILGLQPGAVIGTSSDNDGITVKGDVTTSTTVPAVLLTNTNSFTASSSVQKATRVQATINQTSTAGYTGLEIAVTETGLGSGARKPLSILTGASGTTEVFYIDNTGHSNATNGSNSLPAYSFVSETTTGMYLVGASNLGFSLGGALELSLTTSALTPGAAGGLALGTTSLPWQQAIVQDGTDSNNAFTFGSDVATGMYKPGSNQLGFSANGAQMIVEENLVRGSADQNVALGSLNVRWAQAVTSGNVVKSSSGFTGSEVTKVTATARTTGTTPTNIFSLTLSDNRLYWFEASIIGRDEAGTERAYYVRRIRAHRQGGGGATLGTPSDDFSDESVAGLNAAFAVSSNDLLLQVTGLTTTNISWAATVTYQGVSTDS